MRLLLIILIVLFLLGGFGGLGYYNGYGGGYWGGGGGTMFSLNGAGPFVITNNILGADEEYSPPWFAGNPGGQTKWGSNVTPAGVAIPVPTGFSNVVAA